MSTSIFNGAGSGTGGGGTSGSLIYPDNLPAVVADSTSGTNHRVSFFATSALANSLMGYMEFDTSSGLLLQFVWNGAIQWGTNVNGPCFLAANGRIEVAGQQIVDVNGNYVGLMNPTSVYINGMLVLDGGGNFLNFNTSAIVLSGGGDANLNSIVTPVNVPVAIAVTASPFTYTAGATNEIVVISSVSSAVINTLNWAGTAIPPAIGTYPLSAGESIVITYTGLAANLIMYSKKL